MGCDERWVRERLNQGQLKGEKKNIGLKEKWFVYAGEVEAALAKRAGTASLSSTEYLASKPAAPPTEPFNPTIASETVIVDTDWNDNDEAEATTHDESRLAWLQSQREALVEVAEEMMRPLVLQLEEKNTLLQQKEEALQAASYQLGYAKGRMQEQEDKIKMLPDFQAKAEKAAKLEREIVEARERAEQLEKSLAESEQRAQLEIRRLNDERDAEAKEKQLELETLTQRVSEFEKSWWHKFFGVKPQTK